MERVRGKGLWVGEWRRGGHRGGVGRCRKGAHCRRLCSNGVLLVMLVLVAAAVWALHLGRVHNAVVASTACRRWRATG